MEISSSPAATNGPGRIGAALAATRIARGLTVDDVGKRILLSPGQVHALEQGDVKVFYSEFFYRQGLQKYATLLGMSAALPVTPAPPATDDAHEPAEAASLERPHRRVLPSVQAVAAAVVILAVIGSAAWWRSLAPSDTAPTADAPTGTRLPETTSRSEPAAVAGPATPSETNAALPPADSPSRSVASAQPPPPPVPGQTTLAVRVKRTTWVFARYADGTVVERSLSAGDTYTIGANPTYLVVGTTDLTLSVDGRPVDITPWVTNNQLRINARAFLGPELTTAAP